jgi:hypothetical protein
MPENLQEGQKAGELSDAIDQLEEMICQAEELSMAEVEFPGMFG